MGTAGVGIPVYGILLGGECEYPSAPPQQAISVRHAIHDDFPADLALTSHLLKGEA
jgi:hypothetical protein